MDKEEFHKTLKKLHDELKKTKSVNEKDKELLQVLMEDIQKILQQCGGDKVSQQKNFINELSQKISLFEESHPRLVLLMKQVIETLSNMGI